MPIKLVQVSGPYSIIGLCVGRSKHLNFGVEQFFYAGRIMNGLYLQSYIFITRYMNINRINMLDLCLTDLLTTAFNYKNDF